MTCWFPEGSCNHGTDRHRTSPTSCHEPFLYKAALRVWIGSKSVWSWECRCVNLR